MANTFSVIEMDLAKCPRVSGYRYTRAARAGTPTWAGIWITPLA